MNTTQFKEKLKTNLLTIGYFSTPQCNVCKVLKPEIIDIVEENKPWNFEYIDTTESTEVAGQNMVFTVPTIILYAEGKEVKRFGRHLSMNDLKSTVERLKDIFS